MNISSLFASYNIVFLTPRQKYAITFFCPRNLKVRGKEEEKYVVRYKNPNFSF